MSNTAYNNPAAATNQNSITEPMVKSAPVVVSEISEVDELTAIAKSLAELQTVLGELTVLTNPMLRKMVFKGVNDLVGILQVKTARLAKR